jgi:hypothetical protein
MTPTLIRRLPRPGGDAEAWDIGGGYQLLALPDGDTTSITAYRAADRAQAAWLTGEVERIARAAGVWLETTPSIDMTMIVVRSTDVAALLRACAAELAGLARP